MPTEGLMFDLVRSEPSEKFGEEDPEEPFFTYNHVRKCSYFYSYNAICKFLQENKLLFLVRGHDAQDTGYRLYRKTTIGFPSVMTVFSAPNYLDIYNNKGAVLELNENVINVRQFNRKPHPFWLPNFMSVFRWSLPFVDEKITDMALAMLNVIDYDDLIEDDASVLSAPLSVITSDAGSRANFKRRAVRSGIMAVGRASKRLKVLNEDSEAAGGFTTSADGRLLLPMESHEPNEKVIQWMHEFGGMLENV